MTLHKHEEPRRNSQSVQAWEGSKVQTQDIVDGTAGDRRSKFKTNKTKRTGVLVNERG